MWDSINQAVSPIVDSLNSLISFLNPFSDDFFLKLAFVPSDNAIYLQKLDELKATANSKFPVLNDINNMLNALNDSSFDDSGWDGVSVDFGGRYGLNEVQIVSADFVNYVGPKVKFLLSGLMVFCTLMWTLNRFTDFWGRG